MHHRTLDVTHDLRIDHALHRTLQQSAERAPILRSARKVPSSTSCHSVPPPPLCASLECRASTLLSMRLSARSEVRSRARSSGQVEWSMPCTVACWVQITIERATACQPECMVLRKVDCLVEWPVERPLWVDQSCAGGAVLCLARSYSSRFARRPRLGAGLARWNRQSMLVFEA